MNFEVEKFSLVISIKDSFTIIHLQPTFLLKTLESHYGAELSFSNTVWYDNSLTLNVNRIHFSCSLQRRQISEQQLKSKLNNASITVRFCNKVMQMVTLESVMVGYLFMFYLIGCSFCDDIKNRFSGKWPFELEARDLLI